MTGAPAAKKLPTAQARKKAAAILLKEDADFRAFLAKGESVTGTPQFTAWYQQAIVGLERKRPRSPGACRTRCCVPHSSDRLPRLTGA
ncbi:hypothetical protein ACFW1F_24175 [Streptomyces bungoensis]|uniref:hypothetical protein n=1 Tax=Streptomyces bungoensis TaxID=285568 RepID=UPI0034266069